MGWLINHDRNNMGALLNVIERFLAGGSPLCFALSPVNILHVITLSRGCLILAIIHTHTAIIHTHPAILMLCLHIPLFLDLDTMDMAFKNVPLVPLRRKKTVGFLLKPFILYSFWFSFTNVFNSWPS